MLIVATVVSFTVGYLIGAGNREPRDTGRLRLSKLAKADSSWLNKKL
jgi:hypothetical protein